MKESENNLSFYSSAIIQAIFAILLLIILSYIYKLENMGCECSEHPNKDFIKNFTVIALGYFIITSVISLKSIAKSMGFVVVQLLSIATFVFFLMFVVYIYYAFDYVRYLTNEKCKCSEDLSRDIISRYYDIPLPLLDPPIHHNYHPYPIKHTKQPIIQDRSI